MSDKKLIERMKTLLDYDAETGVFTWKVSRRGVKAGGVAGYLRDDGYVQIRVNGKRYLGHRIAFAFEHGYFPKFIDHKNRNRSDNRIKNLREVTPKENNMNRSMSSMNISGYTGVCWDKNNRKWLANIQVDGKTINLGRFKHKHEAIQARVEANRKYGFYQGHGLQKQTALMEVA